MPLKPHRKRRTLSLAFGGVLALSLLTACSTSPAGVSGLCTVIPPLLRDYTPEDRSQIADAMVAFPAVRKPVETAVALRELHQERCE